MDPTMMGMVWDSPMVSQLAFPARAVRKGHNLQKDEEDGVVEVDADVTVGYRLYFGVKDPKVVIVFFHGNAELCADLSFFIHDFYRHHAAVLAVDYRGYGWSTGTAQFAKLCPDADRIADKLSDILKGHGLEGVPLVLLGRSIGATCAVHLAATHPERFRAVVIESGLMTVKDLPMIQPILAMIPNAQQLLPLLPEPVQTLEKMRAVRLPTLIVHGDVDEIVPYAQATAAFANCPAPIKRLEKVRGGGHNDLQSVGSAQLQRGLEWIIRTVTAPPLTCEKAAELSVKELKQELQLRNVDCSGCVEKLDLVRLLQSHL
eukprot:GGOE01061507.1.p1 GENE.GGOE01061507.1~~GGOE01061507.1.p1  ORF type:complete len:317 (+),score=97.95 GGOE01061507.1:38-988(+)